MDTEEIQKKPHRVALIASEHTFSQYPVFLKHLLIGLADESIPVALICPNRCNVESLVIGAVEIIRYPILELPFFGHFNNKFLLEQLTKFKPTILHCLCESQAAETKFLAMRMNLPYVLMVNSMHKHFSLNSYDGRNLPLSQEHCKKIIVPSKSIADNVIKVYPHCAGLVQQVNHGTFAAGKICSFSRQSNYITIIMSYPAQYDEMIENVFGAIRHLKIEGNEFLIFLISSDLHYPRNSFITKKSKFASEALKTETRIWNMVSAMDLAQLVTMVPGTILWRQVLASGDIFISPVQSHIFNSILLEAMSVGIASAAAKGDVDDFLIPDETSVILDNKNELAITETLRKLLGRPEFAKQIAKNAQQYVKKNHSVSNMIAQIMQIYNEAEN